MSESEAKRLSGYYKEQNEILKTHAETLKGIRNADERRMTIAQEIANNQRVINELEKEYLAGAKGVKGELDKIKATQKDLIASEKATNTQLNKQIKRRRFTLDLATQLSSQLKIGWKYLQDQDKIIKSITLNLGMSGAKATAMRDSFEKSAGYVTRLGGTISDIQGVMQGYADETGRARVMSAEMVKDITAIGKGTGLGIEQATKLGAQFELMGFDAKSTMDYVQGVVDTSERMGVNTTKVLKVVNDNFKRLNKYTFQQGVKGFAEMAMYAEKFKIDINQALNAADVARSLEGAIDLSAQLQVMGGEFARTDPFELLYLARNDPAKMQERLADMTKGLVSFRKVITDDGKTVFEKFISPADRDRIAAVEKSMNLEAGSMVIIAERQAEIQKMRKEMGGIGLSKDQKEVVEGAAKWDAKLGKFQVQLGDSLINIGDLTRDQAEAFSIEQVLLEERAKEAMTFNDTFKAIIETLKAALLPMLKAVNGMLKPLAWIADGFSKIAGSIGGWWKAGTILLTAATAWKFATLGMNHMLARYLSSGMGKFMGSGKAAVSAAHAIPATGAGSSGLALQRAGIGQGAAAKGAGIKNLGTGAGLGTAMVGAGAGLMLAAKGVSQLADSMSKLTPKQAEALASVVKSLSWFMVGAAAAAIGVALLGATATAAAGGLLAFGAAIFMVGAGIGIAATGIGFMGKGLAELVNAGKDAGPAMMDVGKGIGFIALSMMGFTAGAAGFLVFAATMRTLSKHAPAMATVGEAFKNIQTVLSGSKDDFIAVENAVKSISGTNVKSGGYFAELANLLKKPLQVEFANNGRVSMTNDITLNLDGQRFMEKAYDVNIAVQKHESLKYNKGS